MMKKGIVSLIVRLKKKDRGNKNRIKGIAFTERKISPGRTIIEI
jgi:hypothetical protein